MVICPLIKKECYPTDLQFDEKTELKAFWNVVFTIDTCEFKWSYPYTLKFQCDDFIVFYHHIHSLHMGSSVYVILFLWYKLHFLILIVVLILFLYFFSL